MVCGLLKLHRRLFAEAARRDGLRCVKCKRFGQMLTVDHKTRVADGGSRDDIKNIQLLCLECHKRKDEPLSGFRKLSETEIAFMSRFYGTTI